MDVVVPRVLGQFPQLRLHDDKARSRGIVNTPVVFHQRGVAVRIENAVIGDPQGDGQLAVAEQNMPPPAGNSSASRKKYWTTMSVGFKAVSSLKKRLTYRSVL